MQGRYTLTELSSRFNLTVDEVDQILAAACKPISIVGKQKVFDGNAVAILRAEMLRRPLQAIPPKNDVVRNNG